MDEAAKQARLSELRNTARCGDDPSHALDNPSGLIDLVQFAQPKSVLEIGCARGVSTEVFLLHCDRVVAVDPWENVPEHFEAFMARCGGYPNLFIVRGASPQALSGDFPFNPPFDMVYVDAVHVYQPLIDDVRAAFPLIADDGWIAGHDYWPELNGDDVVPAVDALFGAGNFKVFSDGSWLIRKPASLPDTPPAEGRLLRSPSMGDVHHAV